MMETDIDQTEMRPSVSVVMATYNGEKYIAQQLRSIIEQTYTPIEIIISDDGSTDRTIEMIQQHAAETHIPVRIYKNPVRLGYSDNFLSATTHAIGKYIAFSDQDDVWHEEKLSRCISTIEKYDCILCSHSATLIDENSTEIGSFQNGAHREGVYAPLTLTPWTTFAGFSMVFRSDLLRIIPYDARGIDYFLSHKPLSHDAWIYFLASCFGRVAILDESLAMYRQHSSNVIGSSSRGILEKLSYIGGSAAHPRLARDEIAEHWSNLLRNVSSHGDVLSYRTKAELASDYWITISMFERRRVEMYLQNAPLKRAASFFSLAIDGCYRASRKGGLGIGLLLKDVVVGLLRMRPIKA